MYYSVFLISLVFISSSILASFLIDTHSCYIQSIKADFHSVQNVARSIFRNRVFLKCVQSGFSQCDRQPWRQNNRKRLALAPNSALYWLQRWRPSYRSSSHSVHWYGYWTSILFATRIHPISIIWILKNFKWYIATTDCIYLHGSAGAKTTKYRMSIAVCKRTPITINHLKNTKKYSNFVTNEKYLDNISILTRDEA